MSGGSKTQTVGYRYYFGIHMGIGRGPVDALHEIQVGEREAWKGEATANTTIDIDKPTLFGGEEKEGGIKGPLQLMFGNSDQEASSGLKGMLGDVIPGFRGVFTAFFNGLVCMNNPYPKTWKFRLNRTLKGWDGPVFEPALARILLNAPTNNGSATVNGTPVGTLAQFQASWAAANPGFELKVVGEVVRVAGNPNYTKAMAEKYGLAWTQYEVGYSTVLLTAFPTLSGVDFSKVDEGLVNNDEMMVNVVNNGLRTDELFNVRGPGGELIPAVLVPSGSGAPSLPTGGDPSGLVCSMPTPGGVPRPGYTWAVGTGSSVGDWCGESPIGYPATLSAQGTITSVGAPGFTWNLGAYPNTMTGIGALDLYEGNYIRARIEGAYDAEPEYPAYSMNAAHIIYECLTNRVWGRGLPSAKLDTVSFAESAQTLFDEGFGLCLKWTRKDEIATFIQSILDHIGATLYVSRISGLLTLKLIRADYDLDTLPLFDTESGILEVSDLSVSSVGSAVNAVFVTYHDWRTDEDQTVGEKNTAAIAAAGGVVNSVTKNYPGIPTSALALRVALRDLRSASTSLRKFKLVMDRRAEEIEPGSVFAIQDPKRGIPKMAVRVGAVEDGTVTDGRITITVAQDVFSLPQTAIGANVPNTWTPPNTRPCIPDQYVMEMPYFMLAGSMTKADLDYVGEDSGFIAALSARGQPLNQGFQLAVRDGAPTGDNALNDSYICEI